MSQRPIYGVSAAINNGCYCVPDPPLTDALIKLRSVLEKLRTVINNFYNPALSVAEVIGNMTMTAKVSFPVFVRLKWIETHPNTKFDKTNPAHQDDIRFLYNIANKDWHTDPMFKALNTTT